MCFSMLLNEMRCFTECYKQVHDICTVLAHLLSFPASHHKHRPSDTSAIPVSSLNLPSFCIASHLHSSSSSSGAGLLLLGCHTSPSSSSSSAFPSFFIFPAVPLPVPWFLVELSLVPIIHSCHIHHLHHLTRSVLEFTLKQKSADSPSLL